MNTALYNNSWKQNLTVALVWMFVFLFSTLVGAIVGGLFVGALLIPGTPEFARLAIGAVASVLVFVFYVSYCAESLARHLYRTWYHEILVSDRPDFYELYKTPQTKNCLKMWSVTLVVTAVGFVLWAFLYIGFVNTAHNAGFATPVQPAGTVDYMATTEWQANHTVGGNYWPGIRDEVVINGRVYRVEGFAVNARGCLESVRVYHEVPFLFGGTIMARHLFSVPATNVTFSGVTATCGS